MGHVYAAPVNINTADAKTIADALADIGLKKAEAIIKYRQAHGPFKSPDELENVAGIGNKTLQKIRADILVEDSGSEQAPSLGSAAPVTGVKDKK